MQLEEARVMSFMIISWDVQKITIVKVGSSFLRVLVFVSSGKEEQVLLMRVIPGL